MNIDQLVTALVWSLKPMLRRVLKKYGLIEDGQDIEILVSTKVVPVVSRGNYFLPESDPGAGSFIRVTNQLDAEEWAVIFEHSWTQANLEFLLNLQAAGEQGVMHTTGRPWQKSTTINSALTFRRLAYRVHYDLADPTKKVGESNEYVLRMYKVRR